MSTLVAARGVRTPLPGGGVVLLRPLGPGESAPLEAVFAAMSAESRHHRYLTGLPRLPAPMLAALTDVDGRRHVAWTAVLDGRPVGLARYVLEEPGVAEIAFEVADAHHGSGIGSALVDAVTTVAAAQGVRRLRAVVQPGNRASQRLLGRVGVPLTVSGGLLEGEGRLQLLDPALVDRAAVVHLARAGAWRIHPGVVG
ncbi:GNAT family N-acetyltransferase [Nocardioides sp. GXQ0305]|uniref:GNAT family N-acetyltransferase n=1 Tax=Nocardioides sp. GXQ0305 TaxID=3423912 RepID=UPI003D7C3969